MTLLELFELPIDIDRDISYGSDQRQKLDVYAPPNIPQNGAPVLLWLYGGGWRSGDKRLFEHLGRAFAHRGVITVAVNYRLTPQVTHPGHVKDVALAIAWVRDEIEGYGGDRDRLILSGHSAGGHLAALLALDRRYLAEIGVPESSIRGCIPISGATDLSDHADSGTFTSREQIEEAFGNRDAKLVAASPVNYVTPDDPPFLIMMAEGDPTGLQEQGRRLADALRDMDVYARYVTIKGRDHFSIVRRFGSSHDATANAAFLFIERFAKGAAG